MYSKIQITGVLETKTGMHIGGSTAFSAIGAVDSPVIKDVITNKPMIPGSSLKGKMRTVLAKKYNKNLCANPDDDDVCITRVFGSAKKDKAGKVKPSKILISDMFMINEEEIRNRGLQSFTEVKFENNISRTTAVAMPRQIERAIKGLKFEMDIIYEVINGEESNIISDFELIADALKMLEYDYLGGNGSRGYGKVSFSNLCAKEVVGSVDEDIMKKVNHILEEV